MPAFEIRPLEVADVAAVQELYAHAFHEPDRPMGGRSLLERLAPRQGDARALVAVSRGRIVGMGSFERIADAPRDGEMLRGFVRAARAARRSGRLHPAMQSVAGLELRWESYDNGFVRSELEPDPSDVFLTAMAVAQPFRGLGIGTALAEGRIALALAGGARAVYVGCWSGGRSAHLYEKLGFLPIVEWGPAYDDGTTMKLMARVLEPFRAP